ncbi:ERAD-associated E3 ubiquitin-protein ligase HRD1B-like [Rhagoletis pomonella]|uniref:ERAD-associated E3 ubiquitin-protein ligase HRD1B-like n=1 Tax=Rhagoletis pomonella TaxID=28610 RepID=UPI001784C9C2|nr:ERAD-associated E3 ubiquitin-protein ligase HRD1B-like [Rhagoletis pomonella]
MSIRHSNENLPPQVSVCVICRENFSENDEILKTVCSHKFHRHCLLNWLKRNPSCPQCRTACSSRDFLAGTGARSRAKQTATSANSGGNNPNLDSTRQTNQPEEGAMGLPINTDRNNLVNVNLTSEEARINTLVNAVISARQASIFDGLETRVTQLLEQQIEGALTNLLSRVNLNGAPPVASNNSNNQNQNISQQNPHISTPVLPREMPYFEN